MTILFDKLVYIDRLTRAGVPEDQARAHADAMDVALHESVATKGDVTALKADLETRLAQLETRLSLRFGAIIVAGVAVLLGIKFFG